MYYCRKPDVRIQQVNGETLVLNDQHGYIHQLNETASFVWRHCDGRSSLSDIVHRLTEKFDVESDIAANDVKEIIEKLCESRLLCTVDPDS